MLFLRLTRNYKESIGYCIKKESINCFDFPIFSGERSKLHNLIIPSLNVRNSAKFSIFSGV